MTTYTDARDWENMTEAAKRQWPKLTDHDLRVIDGDKDELVAALEELYGEGHDILAEHVEAFFVRERLVAAKGAQRVADSDEDNRNKARDVAAEATAAAARAPTPGKRGAKPGGAATTRRKTAE